MTINVFDTAQIEKHLLGAREHTSKLTYRGRDIIISFLGLLMLSPLLGIIAILIRRDSPGPIFYWAHRVGRDGKLIKILKFRTMYDRPESFQGARITAQNDPRVTSVGQWLRDTKLNELPQLWNVLIGEMSLIGPRPEDPEFVAKWPEKVRQIILSVCPGITSPASVLYRDEESLLPEGDAASTYLDSLAPQKMRLDQIYVNNRNFWLDLDVLFWTVLVLVPRLGKYKLPEEKLYWGPISRFFKRYVNWFSIDAALTFVAFSAAILFLRTFVGPLHVGWPRLLVLSILFALLFSGIGAMIGIHRIYWSKASAMDVVYLVPAVGLAMGIALVVNMIIKIFPPGLIIVGSGIVFIGFVFVRYRSRLITGTASRLLSRWNTPTIAKERVLIVGGGDAGQSAAWMIQNSESGSAFHIVGYIDDDIYKDKLRIRGIDVLGTRTDIPEIVKKHDVGIIVFAIHRLSEDDQREVMRICDQTPTRTVVMPNFLGRLSAVASILSNIHEVENRMNTNGYDEHESWEDM